MRNRDLDRRKFLLGSSAVAAGAMLIPRGKRSTAETSTAQTSTVRAGTVHQSSTVQTPARLFTKGISGATVAPSVYGSTNWVQAANMFDSYVGLPLAAT